MSLSVAIAALNEALRQRRRVGLSILKTVELTITLTIGWGSGSRLPGCLERDITPNRKVALGLDRPAQGVSRDASNGKSHTSLLASITHAPSFIRHGKLQAPDGHHSDMNISKLPQPGIMREEGGCLEEYVLYKRSEENAIDMTPQS